VTAERLAPPLLPQPGTSDIQRKIIAAEFEMLQ
jgi:hypothetical protein